MKKLLAIIAVSMACTACQPWQEVGNNESNRLTNMTRVGSDDRDTRQLPAENVRVPDRGPAAPAPPAPQRVPLTN